jgi:membrane protease YdiL (CAAX protease family)
MGIGLGYLAIETHFTSLYFKWGLLNIFSVILTEEALFRILYQQELTKISKNYDINYHVAPISSELLFGFAHFADGWIYIGVASVAGLGYAYILQRTSRFQLVVLSHFMINTIHFLFFTYPYNNSAK